MNRCVPKYALIKTCAGSGENVSRCESLEDAQSKMDACTRSRAKYTKLEIVEYHSISIKKSRTVVVWDQ